MKMEAVTSMFKYFPVVTIGFMTQIPALAHGQRKQLMIFVMIDCQTIIELEINTNQIYKINSMINEDMFGNLADVLKPRPLYIFCFLKYITYCL